MSNRGWYRIENAAATETAPRRATVRIYDAIGGWFGADPKAFATDLDALEVDEIELRVNSPGGDVFDGLAIMNTLRRHPARVVAHVDGVAASAASFIVAGGADEVVMNLGAELMVHNPHAITVGDAGLHRDSAARLDKVRDSLVAVYQRRAGGDADYWNAVLDAETWFSAQEAVDAGLADRLDEDEPAEPVANHVGVRFAAYAGRAQAPAPAMPGLQNRAASAAGHTEEEGRPVAFSDEQLDNLRQRLGIAADADGAAILAALDSKMNEKPAKAELPDGVVAVEAATLAELRADAAAGREARAQQEREGRERLADAAVADGRIAPARRDHWVNALAADPGAADVLADLEKGLIPVNGPIGHDGEPERGADDVYALIYGSEG